MSDYIPNLFSAARRAAQRAATALIPESVRRRVSNFTNWLTGNVEPEQFSRVLGQIAENLREHYPPHPPEGPDLPPPPLEIRTTNSAFARYVTQHDVDVTCREHYPPNKFLKVAEGLIIKTLQRNVERKVKLVLRAMFCRYNNPEDAREFAFHSKSLVNLNKRGARKLYEYMVGEILEKISVLERQESGWVFISMVSLELHRGYYMPLRGRGYLPLPKWISDKKACVNMQNEDNKCFLWCILRNLYPIDNHAERVDQDLKARENVINMEGIEYPVTLKDIYKFEKQNPEISVNVYSYKKEERFYPLRVTKDEKTNHVDLLYIKNEENTHYALIKKFGRLMNSQI